MSITDAIGDRARRVTDEAGARVAEEAREYEHGHSQPLLGYAGTGLAYTGVAVALVAASRLAGRRAPARFGAADIVLGGFACHKFSRLLAKDAVTSPLRAPFTRFRGPAGSSEVQEEVRGVGARHAVGELVSCPFCLAPWTATAYVGGLTLVPRAARTWAAVFSVVGLSDMLQHAYARLRAD